MRRENVSVSDHKMLDRNQMTKSKSGLKVKPGEGPCKLCH